MIPSIIASVCAAECEACEVSTPVVTPALIELRLATSSDM